MKSTLGSGLENRKRRGVPASDAPKKQSGFGLSFRVPKFRKAAFPDPRGAGLALDSRKSRAL